MHSIRHGTSAPACNCESTITIEPEPDSDRTWADPPASLAAFGSCGAQSRAKTRNAHHSLPQFRGSDYPTGSSWDHREDQRERCVHPIRRLPLPKGWKPGVFCLVRFGPATLPRDPAVPPQDGFSGLPARHPDRFSLGRCIGKVPGQADARGKKRGLLGNGGFHPSKEVLSPDLRCYRIMMLCVPR